MKPIGCNVLLLLLFASVHLNAQSDTTKKGNVEMGIGVPMVPVFFNYLENSSGGVYSGPRIKAHSVFDLENCILIPFSLNIKYKVNMKQKLRIGVSGNQIYSKSFDKLLHQIVLLNAGTEVYINSEKNKIRFLYQADVLYGNLFIPSYMIGGVKTPIKSYYNTNLVLFGVSQGLAINYMVFKNIFIEHEICLLFYYTSGYSDIDVYNQTYDRIYQGRTGVAVPKLFSINVFFKL